MATNAPRLVSRLPPLPSIRDILRMYRLQAMKQLSQNFIMDPRICNKIVRAAGNIDDCYVVEIGPGPGNITRQILERNIKQLVVIEKDKRFLPSLNLLADAVNDRMKIIIGDIMEHNMEAIFPEEICSDWTTENAKLHIIGNLPFSVSTPLIIKYLRHMSNRSGPFRFGRTRLTLTFQKEVAERIVAPVMSTERNRLSIMCQYLSFVEYKSTISGESFVPKPDVDVGIVRFTPLKEPRINLPFDLVERVVRSVFHFRQKFCKRGAELLFPQAEKHLVSEMLEKAEVGPNTRAYELSIDEVARICYAYDAICKEHPRLGTYDYRSNTMEKNVPV